MVDCSDLHKEAYNTSYCREAIAIPKSHSRKRAQAVEERLTAAGARNLGRALHCAPTRRIEEAFGKLQHFEAAAPDGGGAAHGFRRWPIVVT